MIGNGEMSHPQDGSWHLIEAEFFLALELVCLLYMYEAINLWLTSEEGFNLRKYNTLMSLLKHPLILLKESFFKKRMPETNK